MDEQKKIYLALLAENRESRMHQASRRDQLIATIAGGTLVLSVTFLVNTVFKSKVIHLEFLFIAWGLLILSLIANICSYVFGDFYFVTRRAVIRKAYKRNDIQDVDEYKQKNPWRWIAHISTYLAVLCVLCGIIILAYFGYLTIASINTAF